MKASPTKAVENFESMLDSTVLPESEKERLSSQLENTINEFTLGIASEVSRG
ncbi:hypothetical protein M1M30_gp030 [Maribacter phage Colly_1]|uniref:Uncharacterized protein n=1 Tax=Maribacter phage Colly_1 TaxID=2745691 RepID=A0A8E4UXZ8_9CAUD|nr:hypothetical protein M1M30_gp030 [Maribacter phage Colly_1]QQO97312.1 hypothetical protein Colly1_30 [Maribacter phage Colly_1]